MSSRRDEKVSGAEKRKSPTSYLINKTLHIQQGTERDRLFSEC